MYSTIDGFLFTGTRCFASVEQIDLWYSDSQASIQLADSEQRILLDEGETQLVRRWADLALQAAIADNEDTVIRRRNELFEQIQRAKKLNRSTSRKRRRRTARPAALSSSAGTPVIDIADALRNSLATKRKQRADGSTEL
jgi:hypothetical protein